MTLKPGDRVHMPGCWLPGTLRKIQPDGIHALVRWDDEAWSNQLLAELRMAPRAAPAPTSPPGPRAA